MEKSNNHTDTIAIATSAMQFANSKIFNPRKTPLLYHYSTIEALYKGILVESPTSEDKAISLFATDHRYLNDEHEIEFGCSTLRRYVKKLFHIDLSNSKNVLTANESIYITSFSQEKDSIPMWSTYGNKGDGIALGFDYQILAQRKYLLSPCIYRSDLNQYIVDVLDRLSKIMLADEQKHLYERMYGLGYVNAYMVNQLKNDCYKYEKEVRLMTYKATKLDYRYRNNLIIPYTKVFFPKQSLKTIVIGPDLDFQKTSVSIREFLKFRGFENVSIIRSRAPYRNL